MHVEIKVAQNFVLNFLYNKLPRRRVNLFGEELESALRDKFADHWYPDKPFKGSAFRCLKITDPADPVLNRAARESGNPVPDIVENLPTDLAIWIDPGEVSYRMGEKGSVKILYSESMDPSYLQSYAIAPDDASPEASAVAAATAAAIAAANSFHPVSGGRGGPVGPGPSGPNFLPLDNLNLAMGGLSMNQANSPSSQQVSPGSVAAVQGSQSSQSKTVGAPPGGPPGPVSVSAGMSQANSGFAPFQPRPHQPITYTAGTFAQTKFGSTKLKSNAKKTNRMSPTEFSNYIKQRAMQKQATAGGPPGGNAPTNMPNGFVGGGGGRGGPMNNRGGNGGHGNLNYGGGSGRIPPHQQNPDPYFYPLFPDRTGGGGNQNNGGGFGYQTTGGGNGTSSSGSAAIPAFGSSGGSSSGSSSASSTTSNPWSFGDADAELFLQDILTVGLNSSKTHTTNNKLDLGFSNNGESSNSFGLGNFHFGGSNGTSSNFVGSTNGSSSFFGLTEDSFGNGVAKPGIRSPQGSPAGENATGTNSSEKYQQRVLVAN